MVLFLKGRPLLFNPRVKSVIPTAEYVVRVCYLGVRDGVYMVGIPTWVYREAYSLGYTGRHIAQVYLSFRVNLSSKVNLSLRVNLSSKVNHF